MATLSEYGGTKTEHLRVYLGATEILEHQRQEFQSKEMLANRSRLHMVDSLEGVKH